jgi:hypothetical protein
LASLVIVVKRHRLQSGDVPRVLPPVFLRFLLSVLA